MGRPEKPFMEKCIPEPNTGCWLWTSGWDRDGYGVMTNNVRAHRASYEKFVGPIPDGMLVCHKCDTPACVNPDHLFLGTVSDNARDMVAKGRGLIGPLNCNSKLDVDDIRLVRHGDADQKTLAEQLGVSRGLIGHIRQGRVWRWVKDDAA